MGKPRMTQRDKWKKRPVVKRYHAFKDQVREHRVVFPEFGARITFCIQMPESWSKKKKQIFDGIPHQQAPDIDNLLKALLDAIFEEDRHVWHIRMLKKVWGRVGYIEIC
jgi:Holliday junction resolvase RusA-like endonuclease